MAVRDVTLKTMCGAVMGFVIALAFFRPDCSSHESINSARRRDAAQPPVKGEIFTLCVTLKFHRIADKVLFQELFEPYARWVENNELTTLSYQLLQSDSNPLEIMLLERYASKSAYLDIHKKTEQFVAYKGKLIRLKGINSSSTFEISGSSYYNADIGFI
jgi:quinol monooxygenase YgiN